MNKTMKSDRKHIHVPDLIEAAQTQLVYKMGMWLRQQPEYPLLFLQDRQTRRRTATLVARGLTTIPTRAPEKADVSFSDPLD